MQPMSTIVPTAITRRAVLLLWAGSISLSLCGCANYWDEAFSHPVKPANFNPFKQGPDPLQVLHDQNADGNLRYKALAALTEPQQHGGTQKEQDDIFQILSVAASKDQAPLCRLAALSALGRFKDPRAAATIDAVYLQQLSFSREMNSYIQQQCLNSLVETGGPIALQRLILVAKEPPNDANAPQSQETLDRRLIAVKGLGKFKEPEAASALAFVLCAPRCDVALRDRAHESLVASTGKNLPPDAPEWKSYLGSAQPIQQAGGPVANTTTVSQTSSTTANTPQPGTAPAANRAAPRLTAPPPGAEPGAQQTPPSSPTTPIPGAPPG